MMRLLVLFLLINGSLFAASGSFSLYLLKDGKPFKSHIVIFKIQAPLQDRPADLSIKPQAAEFNTDDQGYLQSALPQGEYQLQIVNREAEVPKANIKEHFFIAPKKETQLIIALNADDSVAFVDAESPKRSEAIEKSVKKTLQKGSIALQLVSSEDEKPVEGARIFVAGLKIDAKTDKKGTVVLDLPEGNQTLSIIQTGFSSQNVKVQVIANELVSKSVELSPASMELEEFVVLAPHVEGSVAAVIAQERNNDTVGNVLGSEQFSKSGDSSVAAALKRVSGITIVGGKYVYVRGLGERYSTVLLNDLHVPSPEPTKRVVPLDIFPTSVVQSITIQKSYSADLPASFGGGTVLIKSRDVPKKGDGYASAAVELIANSNTGDNVFGNSDNNQPLPASALVNGNNVSGKGVTEDVRTYRTLNKSTNTLPVGFKGEFAIGGSYEINENFILGASATMFYKHTADSESTIFDKYFYEPNVGEIFKDNHTEANVSTITTDISGMVNVGLDYYENNKIKFTYFNAQQERDRTTHATIDYQGETEDRDKTYYEYVETALQTMQVSGTNDLRFNGTHTEGYFDNVKIDWAYEDATATRDEPGSVEINYNYQTSGLNWDRKTWYYYFILDDKVNNYRADISLPFTFNEQDNYTQVGYFAYDKKRDFDSRRFKMLSFNFDDMPEDIDTIYNKYASDLDFSSSFRTTDSYQATQKVNAYYLKQLISVTHNFDIMASVRAEKSTQQLTDSDAVYDPLTSDDYFPGVGLTYRFDNDNMQIRFAYAKSISRPDFREFSNTRYKDPITENIVFGNPDLKSTYIEHYDLKYEWYGEGDQTFSFALFGKTFKDPIERVIRLDDAQDNTFLETYQNAKSATSYGAEADLRQRFGFVSDRLSNLLFVTNVAYIQSNIVLDDDPSNTFTKRLTSKERPMQGQSPYVVNLSLGYDNQDNGDSALFLFNQIGPRIVSLGTDKNEDIYQQPFAKLDFVTQWKLNNYFFKKSDFSYAIKFKAKNLLNSDVVFKQGDNITAQTTPGREFSLSFKISY